MKISAQEEYGLRCLLHLARAWGQSLTLPEIAAAEGLSIPYAAKLLGVMRDANLIDSVRGRSGGYRLSRPPEEVRLGALLLMLGEPLFDEPNYCQRHAGTETEGNCVHHGGGCSLRTLWLTLEQCMRQALDHITLADLVNAEGRIADLLRQRLAEALLEPPAPAPAPELITLNPVRRN